MTSAAASPSGTRAVREAMLTIPSSLPHGTTVAEAQAALARPHVHMLLLTDGRRLVGTLVGADVVQEASPETPALPLATLDGRTVEPDADLAAVHAAMVHRGERRLAVVDAEGALLGLLCLKQHAGGFCSDADVAARRAEAERQ